MTGRILTATVLAMTALAACDRPPPAPDASDIALNHRGVGLTGWFEYSEAPHFFAALTGTDTPLPG